MCYVITHNMEKPKVSKFDFIDNQVSSLKKGIDLQREYFKDANLKDDFETMMKCLENIKTEIKVKAVAKGNKKKIEKDERALKTIKILPLKYRKKTPEGYNIVYPQGTNIRISNALNLCYEILIEQLSLLDLL